MSMTIADTSEVPSCSTFGVTICVRAPTRDWAAEVDFLITVSPPPPPAAAGRLTLKTLNTQRGAPLEPWTRPLRSRYARLDTSEVGEAGEPRKILDSDTLKT